MATIEQAASALPRMALMGLALLASIGAPEAAPSLAVGVGRLEFRDAHLQDTYAAPLLVELSIAGPRVGPLHPALALGVAWDDQATAATVFVAGARTHVLFCPILLRIPFEWQPDPRIALRLGPQAGLAYYREEWQARIPAAGIETKRHGTGVWPSAGIGAEASLRIGRAGSLGLAADYLWAQAERVTVGANPAQQEPLRGGWWLARLTWTLPWPAQP